jgi:hypothetical protein
VTFWRRRRRRPCVPVDLCGLHAVTRTAKIVAQQYQSLVPTTEKDTLMSTPTPNPAQAAVDADVASLTADLTTLATVFTQIQALVAAAQASNTPVATAALDALVSGQAATVVSEFQGLVPPAPPAP